MSEPRRRLVIDTNVFISAALLSTSTSAQLLQHALIHQRVVLCEVTFGELATRLQKPKFDRYISLDLRQSILRDLRAVADWEPNPAPVEGAPRCRDATDNVFIDLALRAGAHMLISGDRDLQAERKRLDALGLEVCGPSDALGVLHVI
jgi:uncharacterized protein